MSFLGQGEPQQTCGIGVSPKHSAFDVGNVCPFRESMRLTVNGETHARSSIARLLFSRRPSTVAGRVRPIVVNSVDGLPHRPVSHVCIEVLKGLQPSRANGDSTSSVVFEKCALGVRAALPDVAPCAPLRRLGATPGHSVSQVPSAGLGPCFPNITRRGFTHQTPATLRRACSQRSRKDNADVSTIADTHPLRCGVGLRWRSRCARLHGETPKPLADQIVFQFSAHIG